MKLTTEKLKDPGNIVPIIAQVLRCFAAGKCPFCRFQTVCSDERKNEALAHASANERAEEEFCPDFDFNTEVCCKAVRKAWDRSGVTPPKD